MASLAGHLDLHHVNGRDVSRYIVRVTGGSIHMG